MNTRQNEETKRQLQQTEQLSALVIAAEAVDVTFIFALKQFLATAFEMLAPLLLFPLIVAFSFIRAALSAKEYFLTAQGQKKSILLKTLVEIATSLVIAAAVLGSLLAAATFTLAAPIIFTIALAFKSLFHLGSALFYGLWASPSPQNKQKMRANLISAGLNGFMALAAGLVLIAHQLSFGLLGAITGGLMAAYALYKAVTITKTQPAATAPLKPQTGPSTTAQLLEPSHLKSLPQPSLPSEPQLKQDPKQNTLPAILIPTLKNKLNETRKILQELKNRILPEEKIKSLPKAEIMDITAILNLKTSIAKTRTTIYDIIRGQQTLIGDDSILDSLRLNEASTKEQFQVKLWQAYYDKHHDKHSVPIRALMKETEAMLNEYNEIIKKDIRRLSHDGGSMIKLPVQATRRFSI